MAADLGASPWSSSTPTPSGRGRGRRERGGKRGGRGGGGGERVDDTAQAKGSTRSGPARTGGGLLVQPRTGRGDLARRRQATRRACGYTPQRSRTEVQTLRDKVRRLRDQTQRFFADADIAQQSRTSGGDFLFHRTRGDQPDRAAQDAGGPRPAARSRPAEPDKGPDQARGRGGGGRRGGGGGGNGRHLDCSRGVRPLRFAREVLDGRRPDTERHLRARVPGGADRRWPHPLPNAREREGAGRARSPEPARSAGSATSVGDPEKRST